MANDKHVAMLRKGMAAWNAWRDENRNISPDLSEAVLEGVDLHALEEPVTEADRVSGVMVEIRRVADLSGANLSGADLSGANLRRANLVEANLVEANLSGATLGKTIFGIPGFMKSGAWTSAFTQDQASLILKPYKIGVVLSPLRSCAG